MTTKAFAILTIWVLFACLGFSRVEGSNSLPGDNTRLVSPVYFVTDRQQHEGNGLPDFGVQVNDPPDHITYGVIDNPRQRKHKERQEGQEKTIHYDKTYNDFAEMSENLHSAVDASSRHELVIFVHGCCIGFKEALRQTRDLQDKVQSPVVLYDWGSPSASYSGSLLACPRSQERFNNFMLSIARAFPDEKVSVIGLSLGNILVDNFFLQYRPAEIGKTFDQIVFARADIDSIAFKSHLSRIAGHARKVFIYADRHDLLLNLSQFLRVVAAPFYHGERVGRLNANLHLDSHVKVVDVSKLNLNHELPCAVVADMLESNGNSPESGHYSYVELPNGLLQVERRKSQ